MWKLISGNGVWFHIARGILGFGLLAIALLYSPTWGAWVAIPAIGALVMLRGCPMCWTAGMVGAVLDRKNNRAGCRDGSCDKGGPNP